MKKYLTKGLIIGLLMISCNEQNIQVKKERLPRITFTTLDKENLLNTALDNFGLTKSGNSSGRMMSGLSEFKSDSILKVLQADSTNYTYTLYLKGDKKDVAFRNLVFQRAKNGFYGFVLEYSSSDAILNVASTTGYVKKYDLEGRLLQETSLKNAKLGRDSKIGRAQACFADVTVECIKYKFGGWDHSTGVPFNECEEYGYIITINCSGGSGGGTGSTNSPGTYIPDPNPSTVVGAGGAQVLEDRQVVELPTRLLGTHL